MPVIGSSAYNTAGQICAIVRSLLNDPAANLYTDGLLMPYINSAYRKVQRALAAAGEETFLVDDTFLHFQPQPKPFVVVTTPTDMLTPMEIWERRDKSTDDFQRMTHLMGKAGKERPDEWIDLTTETPDETCDHIFNAWQWEIDNLYMRVVGNPIEIRLRYQKAFPEFTDGSSVVLIRNAQEAISYNAAALAALARGNPLAESWDKAAQDALEDLIVTNTRRRIRRIAHRSPYDYARS